MLETLERTNIGNLNLEEPKDASKFSFDPAGMISDKDWDEMVGYAGQSSQSYHFREEHLANMAILFPDRIHDVLARPAFELFYLYLKREANLQRQKVTTATKLIGNIHSPLKNIFQGHNPIRFAETILAARMLYPDRLGEFGIEGYWPTFKSLVGTSVDYFYRGENVNLHAITKMAYPAKGIKLHLNEEKHLINQMNAAKENQEWLDFTNFASKFRILYPARFKEIGLNKEVWKGMKSVLEYSGQRNPPQRETFTRMAAEMKILAAHEIHFTEHGLDLMLFQPDEFISPVPAIPEVRKF
ncbi:MAG: hypothetical protein Q7R49_02235 [Candidatus Daviesbacteria bacterium]|nr:hypothetical protein [Candidatus Daviesbacteria bacterium]